MRRYLAGVLLAAACAAELPPVEPYPFASSGCYRELQAELAATSDVWTAPGRYNGFQESGTLRRVGSRRWILEAPIRFEEPDDSPATLYQRDGTLKQSIRPRVRCLISDTGVIWVRWALDALDGNEPAAGLRVGQR